MRTGGGGKPAAVLPYRLCGRVIKMVVADPGKKSFSGEALMPSPFPGTDPFLEDQAVFPDLHDSLIYCLREALNAQLPPPYFVGIGSRVWVETSQRRIGPDVNVLRPTQTSNGGTAAGTGGGAVALAVATEPVVVHVPHDEVREPFLEIHADPGGERLVTTLEVLSLANKAPSSHGREPYLRKQQEVLNSQVHLVEIDLLRGGAHSTAVPLDFAREKAGLFDYHVCVHRFDRLEDYFVYPVSVGQRLPSVAIPLLPEHQPVRIDLQPLLDRCYDTGQYRRRVRYDAPVPPPPLRSEQAAWVEKALRQQGLLQG
jgi:hypothetical protein